VTESESRQAPPVLGPTPEPPPRRGLARLRLRWWFALVAAVLVAFVAVAVATTGIAVYRNSEARHMLVDVVDPATIQALRLGNAVTAEEAALRGLALTADARFIDRYASARISEISAEEKLSKLLDRPGTDDARARLARVMSGMTTWRRVYAEPMIFAVQLRGAGSRFDAQQVKRNEHRFRDLQDRVMAQQRELSGLRDAAEQELNRQVLYLYVALGAATLLLACAVVFIIVVLRRIVVRPVAVLAKQAGQVAGGDFTHPLLVSGPKELAELAEGVDSMRHRIIDEWWKSNERREQLDRQTDELRRSNAELEQFAYVASHDLQEPLRKVASFCQMLERRYGDQLDDRGKQYIAFAVDGAGRMQTLIDDLLSFSRVGSSSPAGAVADMNAALDAALHNLAGVREETDAEVTADDLPQVPGDRTLLTQLLQNLIGNAIKFRGDVPPRVHIGVRRSGAMWEFLCRDNGIGIDPRHSERIFMIFQRLHGQAEYPGTGIGLAMCKKIVEYHGGTIWLDDASAGPGTTFRWTLPALDDPQ
jgi:signal transduction histidine kinase